MGNKNGSASGNSSAASSTTGSLSLDLETFDMRRKLAKMIFKTFLDKSNVVRSVVKEATKQYIRNQIKILSEKSAETEEDMTPNEKYLALIPVFDQANNEIEINFEKHAYPEFLKSDLFLNNVGNFDTKPKTANFNAQNQGAKQNPQPSSSVQNSTLAGRLGYLPSLDEDAVWVPPNGRNK